MKPDLRSGYDPALDVQPTNPQVAAALAAMKREGQSPFPEGHPANHAAIRLWAYNLARQLDARLRRPS